MWRSRPDVKETHLVADGTVAFVDAGCAGCVSWGKSEKDDVFYEAAMAGAVVGTTGGLRGGHVYLW